MGRRGALKAALGRDRQAPLLSLHGDQRPGDRRDHRWNRHLDPAKARDGLLRPGYWHLYDRLRRGRPARDQPALRHDGGSDRSGERLGGQQDRGGRDARDPVAAEPAQTPSPAAYARRIRSRPGRDGPGRAAGSTRTAPRHRVIARRISQGNRKTQGNPRLEPVGQRHRDFAPARCFALALPRRGRQTRVRRLTVPAPPRSASQPSLTWFDGDGHSG